MKKILAITILVIILICINWLNQGYAQMTPDEYQKLQEKYQRQINNKDLPTNSVATYKTQHIYDTAEEAHDNPAIVNSNEPTPSDFSQAAEKENGQLMLPGDTKLMRFGSNLFTQPQVGEVNPDLVPEDYILGPGDNILISLWGRVQQEWNLTVDRQGNIYIPKVGTIVASGQTMGEFQQNLDASLTKVYTGYKQRVTLGKIRTIKIFVYGEVKAPGGYALSALSTLFNALYMAGGPNQNGSFRNIELIRNGEKSTIDLYEFLITGDKTGDRPLLSGDVIFVPLSGAQASVRGEVRRPAIYELKGGEKVSDLLVLAGGPSADAYMGRLMLDRIADNDEREVTDLDFSINQPDDPILADGDHLSVFSIYQMRQNLVWVTGQVKHPGTFEREDGMTISCLLDKGQLLPNRVYLDRADLYRHHPDGRVEILAINLNEVLKGDTDQDICLSDLDSLHIYSTDDIERKKYVYIDGMVRRPGQFPLYENMTAADLIFLAGDLNVNAYQLEAELARVDSSGNTDLIKVDLTRELDNHQLVLQENDRLFVRKIPGYELHRMVTIEGEVAFPGRYSLTQANETLWDLLNRAGGFTSRAFPSGLVFKRTAIVQDLKRQDIDNIVSASLPLVSDSTGTVKLVETIKPDAERLDRIIVNMNLLMATRGEEGNFRLQSGDYIYIPEKPTGVSVLGEVCANGTINYTPNKSVKQYLEQAGGFTRRADKSQTRLVKADGRIISGKSALGKKADLGDVIIVPTEIKKDRDWLKIISTGASILTGVVTSVFIIDRL